LDLGLAQAAVLDQAQPSEIFAEVNCVEPSLIRVEADEVTYNLHIMIRFELEQELLEDRLPISDLPEAWNNRYEQYLGIRPPNDADGVLQDIHWSAGLIGYFPTYTLGNLYAAQLTEAMQQDLGPLDTIVARGDFEPILNWLRLKIHRYGRRYSPIQLMQLATGKELDSQPFVDYLRAKIESFYA
jgi:carboxypeptidase Taq